MPILAGKLSGVTILLPDLDFFISSYITKDAFGYSVDPNNKSYTDADDIAYYVRARTG